MSVPLIFGPSFCLLSLQTASLEPFGGPGPGWELVRLLIKATDVISLERVAQAALLLGNQFAMADAHWGENSPAAQQLFASKYQGSLYWFTSQPCFELSSIACSSLKLSRNSGNVLMIWLINKFTLRVHCRFMEQNGTACGNIKVCRCIGL